jgi:hypothetical protein
MDHVDVVSTQEKKFQLMAVSVPYFWYLQERSWFMTNLELQELLWEVVLAGLGRRVFVAHGNFKTHLHELLNLRLECKESTENKEPYTFTG